MSVISLAMATSLELSVTSLIAATSNSLGSLIEFLKELAKAVMYVVGIVCALLAALVVGVSALIAFLISKPRSL